MAGKRKPKEASFEVESPHKAGFKTKVIVYSGVTDTDDHVVIALGPDDDNPLAIKRQDLPNLGLFLIKAAYE